MRFSGMRLRGAWGVPGVGFEGWPPGERCTRFRAVWSAYAILLRQITRCARWLRRILLMRDMLASTGEASRSCDRRERLAKAGEPGRNRTFNQQIKSLLLCQLSYGPTKEVGSCFDVVRLRGQPQRSPRGAASRSCERSERLAKAGAPSRIRTCDLWLRRPTLYPAELWAQTLPRRVDHHWCARRDLNPQPTGSKPGALSN
jgi:hypothetical protein